MEYRYLGNTGLKVSVVSFGNFVNWNDDKLSVDSVKYCLENGINYFDTAEIYGLGKAETTLGKAFKELKVPREKIVVSTKIFKFGSEPNDGLLSRKHIIEGLRNSLKRLQLDYVDIVFCHKYDKYTPLEETCRAMNFVIQQGMAHYWATSTFTASQIMEIYSICEKLNLLPPIAEQTQYNMFARDDMEKDFRDLFKRYKMGTTIWSPLFGGVLTGKYINDMPKDSRFVTNKDLGAYHYNIYNLHKKEWDEKLIKLTKLAKEKLNCSLTTLAIAWVIANPDVSTVLLGASKVSQLEETIKAVEVYKKITKEDFLEIEKILGNAPEGEMDFRDWIQLPSRRNLLLGIKYPEK